MTNKKKFTGHKVNVGTMPSACGKYWAVYIEFEGVDTIAGIYPNEEDAEAGADALITDFKKTMGAHGSVVLTTVK